MSNEEKKHEYALEYQILPTRFGAGGWALLMGMAYWIEFVLKPLLNQVQYREILDLWAKQMRLESYVLMCIYCSKHWAQQIEKDPPEKTKQPFRWVVRRWMAVQTRNFLSGETLAPTRSTKYKYRPYTVMQWKRYYDKRFSTFTGFKHWQTEIYLFLAGMQLCFDKSNRLEDPMYRLYMDHLDVLMPSSFSTVSDHTFDSVGQNQSKVPENRALFDPNHESVQSPELFDAINELSSSIFVPYKRNK